MYYCIIFMEQSYLIEGEIIPKSRPKVSRKGTYYPQKYKDFLSSCTSEFVTQKAEHNYPEMKTPCKLSIILFNQSKRGDCDNLSGGIMDCLVRSGILRNDNLNNISELNIKAVNNKKSKKYATIRLCN